jgi:4-hydroxy-3-methylbut-2-enyl diphosphate reductase
VIVVGSPNSSNSNRLREVAETLGVEAHMIDKASELRPEWLQGCKRIGLTAGASAPEVLVLEVIARLQELGVQRVTQLQGKEEGITFPLPKGLSAAA